MFFEHQGHLFETILDFMEVDLRHQLLEFRSKVWESQWDQEWPTTENASTKPLKRL